MGFGFYIRHYLSSKAKNLATKEDIGTITEIVEKIKADVALDNQKAALVYQEKFNTILDALSFIDDYISWHDIDNQTPIRKKITVVDLTLRARSCFNRLMLTCDNEEIVELFLKIFENNSAGSNSQLFLDYNKFRLLLRKELNIVTDIKIPEKYYFIRCATIALSAKKSKAFHHFNGT